MVDLSYLYAKNEIGLLPSSSLSFFIAAAKKSVFVFEAIDDIKVVENDLKVLNKEFLKLSEDVYENLPYLLYELLTKKPDVVLLTKKLLIYDIPHIDSFKNVKKIMKNSSLILGELRNWLNEHGYERCDEATSPYEYAIRGSVVDVSTGSRIFRINFEYNRILSIKEIDPVEFKIKEITSAIFFPKSFGGKIEDYIKDYRIYSNWNVDYPGIKFNVPYINEGIESIFDEEPEKYLLAGYKVYYYTDKDTGVRGVNLIKGNLSGSFKTKDEVVIGKPAKSHQNIIDYESTLEIKRGDYVVHTDHGIGIFKGVVEKEYLDGKSEFLAVEFKNKTILYIPITQISKIKPYRSFLVKRKPKLSSLTSTAWQKKKLLALLDAENFARELLELYARREVEKSTAYKKVELEDDFISSFGFELTADQKKTIDEIMDGLATNKAIEHVIIGDVGIGKTIPAMLAAFRVAAYGKQVLVLVPTTALALNHYEKFLDKFTPFGIKVGLLTRLMKKSEVERALLELMEGKIEILIATIRALSEDVLFKDLGLLIIDEEQRFGVRQKEYIKSLKPDVKVIVLSATPIPRTLFMCLAKLRPFSRIETHPPGKLPVTTVLKRFDIKLVIEAINFEVKRGGQVFYVLNNVNELKNRYKELKSIFPDLRIAISYSKMPDRELEKIFYKFFKKEYDMLLATTIIENGLDLKSVNTIIIENAHTLGLTDLYHLRGRVGRTNIQAYCYLFYPSERCLTNEVLNRIKVIIEFVSTGSGFKVALKDLELRGAGEILGKRQHGFVNSIGLDLYLEMLENKICEIKKIEPVKYVFEYPFGVVLKNYSESEKIKIARMAFEEVDERILDMDVDENLKTYIRIRKKMVEKGIKKIEYNQNCVSVDGKKLKVKNLKELFNRI